MQYKQIILLKSVKILKMLKKKTSFKREILKRTKYYSIFIENYYFFKNN